MAMKTNTWGGDYAYIGQDGEKIQGVQMVNEIEKKKTKK